MMTPPGAMACGSSSRTPIHWSSPTTPATSLFQPRTAASWVGRPETAVKYPVFAAVYSDADRGADDAGLSRLPALDDRGIAGACVSAFSARIGDGRSIYADGYISAVNDIAAGHGGAIGQSCRDFVALMVDARIEQTK